jgi:acyl-CoA synthetase (AMP-forming)/AMP-acid ligase II
MGRLGQRVKQNGKTWWSLEAERRALGVEGVAFASYFGVADGPARQKAVLCVETQSPAPDLENRLRSALAPYPLDRYVAFKRLPKDPRHASKIDLGRLKTELLKRGLL